MFGGGKPQRSNDESAEYESDQSLDKTTHGDV